MNRRSIVALCAASALLATPFAALASTGGAAPSTVTTVPGLASVQARGVTDLGPAHEATAKVDMVLAPRDAQSVDALIASGKTVTAAEYDARFAPTAAQAAVVTSWAHAQGLVATVAPGRTLVQVSGTTRNVGDAFGVRFRDLRLAGGREFRGTVSTARLPRSVAAVTRAVVGLSDLNAQTPQRPAAARPASTINVIVSFGPQDFWKIYHAPTTATGAGQALAIITAGDISQAQADLPKFEDHFGLPHVPFNQIQVGPAGTDTSAATEWDLDSQYSTGFAPDASSLTSYTATSLLNTDILPTISRWVTDNANREASFSAGECESLASVSGFTAGLNAVLQRGAAQGQSLFVSSGDQGAYCSAVVGVNGVPAGIPDTEYPASSPYAVGVGGTTIYQTDPTKEITWYATGGGIAIEKAPAWQVNVGGSYLKTGHRGVPDVALDADPDTGYTCVINGVVTRGVGGTSAGAPSWQGIWARAQSAHGGSIGFAGRVAYQVPATVFHDVKIGANGLYPARPGWDYTTGRGTPDITLFVNRA
ncbi:MAG: protease pro-enzyme activation domain-containing protein [Actinomycetes bacterium]